MMDHWEALQIRAWNVYENSLDIIGGSATWASSSSLVLRLLLVVY